MGYQPTVAQLFLVVNMDQVVTFVVDYVSRVPLWQIYLIITLIAYAENILPPVPGDVLVAFGGYLASLNLLNIPILWLLTVVASILGFMSMYRIGSFLGHPFLEKATHLSAAGINNEREGWSPTCKNVRSFLSVRGLRDELARLVMRYAKPEYIQKGLGWMRKYGQWIVVSNRFLAGTRSVIALTAGASHMSVVPTILSASISSMLWNSLLLYGGWFLGDNWRIIGRYLEQYSLAILVVLLLFLVFGYLWYKLRKK